MITNNPDAILVDYTKNEIKDIIKDMMVKVGGYEFDQINHESNLIDVCDSLDLVDFLMKIESEFNIRFSESDEAKIFGDATVKNIYKILTKYIQPKD